MLDKDKIYIAVYIDVTYISRENMLQLLNEVRHVFQNSIENDGSVVFYVLPVRNAETKVECINPVLATEEEKEKIEKALANMDKVEDILKEFEK